MKQYEAVIETLKRLCGSVFIFPMIFSFKQGVICLLQLLVIKVFTV